MTNKVALHDLPCQVVASSQRLLYSVPHSHFLRPSAAPHTEEQSQLSHRVSMVDPSIGTEDKLVPPDWAWVPWDGWEVSRALVRLP